MAEPLFP